MSAGELRDLVSLQTLNPAVCDGLGQPVASWTEFAQVWANIRHQSGLGVVMSDQPLGIVRASIKVRSIPGLVSGMRVVKVDGSETYTVKSVVLETRQGGAYTYLICEALS